MPRTIERPRAPEGFDRSRFGGPGNGGGNGNGQFGAMEPFPIPKAQLGIWLLLASGTILFSAIVSAYVVRMGFPGWTAQPGLAILWVNTALLIVASLLLERASRNARWPDAPHPKNEFLVGGLFGLLFIAGQVAAWFQLQDAGHLVHVNPAIGFFYLITGLHGAHMIGGFIGWAAVMRKLWRTDSPSEHQLGVRLCANYWHFLLIVWLVMFALMQVT